MQVNAINNLSFQGSHNNVKKSGNNTQSNPIEKRGQNQTNNVSNNAFTKATRALALAMVMIPVGGVVTSGLTSCSDEINISNSHEHTTINPKDTLYIPIWQKPDTVYLDKIIRDTIFQKDTIKLPGDTIIKTDTIIKNDTIKYPVIIPGDTVFVPKKFDTEVFDIMKDMMEEVGIKTEGSGDYITRMIATDEWENGALTVYDWKGKKSSDETPAFDKTTYGWDDEEEQVVIGKNMTYGQLDISKSQNGGLYLEHKVPRNNPAIKPSTADGYRLDKETTLTKGAGMLYRKDITNGEVDKGRILPGDKPQSIFFYEPLGERPGEELMWRWSDIAVKLGEKPEDQIDE